MSAQGTSNVVPLKKDSDTSNIGFPRKGTEEEMSNSKQSENQSDKDKKILTNPHRAKIQSDDVGEERGTKGRSEAP